MTKYGYPLEWLQGYGSNAPALANAAYALAAHLHARELTEIDQARSER